MAPIVWRLSLYGPIGHFEQLPFLYDCYNISIDSNENESGKERFLQA